MPECTDNLRTNIPSASNGFCLIAEKEKVKTFLYLKVNYDIFKNLPYEEN